MPSSTIAPGQRRLLISLYAIAAFLYWIAQYLFVPTLPVYVRSKTENLALVGVVLAMYGLWQAIIRLPLGIAVDWLGWRKPFILVCFALAGLGPWMMGVADNVTWLLVGRAITGLAAGSWVLLIVAFSRLFPAEEAVRATTLLTLVSSLSRMIATGVTGFLNNWGGYTLAFFLATAAAVLSMLVMIPVKERRRPPQRPTMQSLVTLIFRRDVLLPSLLDAVVQYAVWGATFGFLPILARQLGATNVMQSLLVSLSIAVVIIGNLATTAILHRIGTRRLVALNFVLIAIGVGFAAFASSLWFVFAVQVFIGFGSGIGYPVLMGMSIQYVAETERATAMGLHQAIYAIGMFAGPWLSGMLAKVIGIQPMFGVTSVACLVLGLLGTYWLSGVSGQPKSSA
jgi:DHA1 family multidrug resistance protein-like MFS transporter